VIEDESRDDIGYCRQKVRNGGLIRDKTLWWIQHNCC